MPIHLTCHQCGSSFVRPPSQARLKYCSRICMGKAAQTKQERTCERCGGSFIASGANIKKGKGKYCGRSCFAQTQADRIRLPERACVQCGRQFRPRVSRILVCGKSCARRLANGSLHDRLWAQIDKTTTCWPGMGRNGLHWKLRRAPGEGKVYAHVAAWEEATGLPVPDGGIICHTCDVGACVRNDDEGVYVVNGVEHPRWGHLWLGTDAANSADKVAKGRQSKGEGTGVAKLDPSRVLAILAMLAEGHSRAAVARAFNVAPHTILKIDIGEAWKHVPRSPQTTSPD